MNTVLMLMAKYDSTPIIPAKLICEDFFNLSYDKFMRKIRDGDIDLPIVSMEDSQKSAKGAHVSDIADYIDTRAAKARRERDLLHG